MSCKKDSEKSVSPLKKVIPKPVYKYGYKLNDFKVIQDTIKSGESFGIILDRHHIFYPKINQIASSIKESFLAKIVYGFPALTLLTSKVSFIELAI